MTNIILLLLYFSSSLVCYANCFELEFTGLKCLSDDKNGEWKVGVSPDETLEPESYKPLSYLWNPPKHDSDKVVWYKIDNEGKNGQSFFLAAIDQVYSATADGKEFSHYGKMVNGSVTEFYGYRPILISIPDGTHELILKVSSETNNIGIVHPVFYGNRFDVLYTLLVINMGRTIVGFGLILIAIITLFVYLLSEKRPEVFYLGITSLFGGLYLFIRHNLIRLALFEALGSNHFLIMAFLDSTTWFIIASSILCFFVCIKNPKLVKYPLIYTALFLSLTIIEQSLFNRHFTLPILQLTAFLIPLALLYILIDIRKQLSEIQFWAFLFSILGIYFSFGWELLSSVSFFERRGGYYIIYGLLFYTIVVVWYLYGIAAKKNITLKENLKNLEMQRVRNKHLSKELKKMTYPHQVELIRQGYALEETMPSSSGYGAVISFDVQNSSKIGHTRNHAFFEELLIKCNKIMTSYYDKKNLKANAYLIKELGDGFLCSVGFPFGCGGDPTTSAYALSLSFVDIFRSLAEKYFPNQNQYCSIGIACGNISGYFPKAGLKRFDLYGEAIVLANRYEAYRKNMFSIGNLQQQNIICVREDTYKMLAKEMQKQLKPYNTSIIKVRDDIKARQLFYQTFPGHIKENKDDSLKKQFRIMIVDDDTDILDSLEEIFLEFRQKVQVYSDPQLALLELQRQPFDIVLTDIHMKDVSGYDVLKAAKISGCKNIYAMSGQGGQEKWEVKKHASCEFIAKPLSEQNILKLLENSSKEGPP